MRCDVTYGKHLPLESTAIFGGGSIIPDISGGEARASLAQLRLA
jgi:hypothetical protein